MEENFFPQSAVADALSNFVEARIHTDDQDAEIYAANLALQKKYAGTPALPTYVIIDPATGEKISVHRLKGAENGFEYLASKFTKWLNKHKG